MSLRTAWEYSNEIFYPPPFPVSGHCVTRKRTRQPVTDRPGNTSHSVATYSACDFTCTMEIIPPAHRAIVSNTWKLLVKPLAQCRPENRPSMRVVPPLPSHCCYTASPTSKREVVRSPSGTWHLGGKEAATQHMHQLCHELQDHHHRQGPHFSLMAPSFSLFILFLKIQVSSWFVNHDLYSNCAPMFSTHIPEKVHSPVLLSTGQQVPC